jgi:hypothetical protein
MAVDGNIIGIDLTGQDIRRGFEIFGKHPAAVRGKAKKVKNPRREPDDTLKQLGTNQVLHADVMHVGGRHFLVAVASPLQLVITSPVKSESTDHIGLALQDIGHHSQLWRVPKIQNNGQPG